MLGTRIRSVGLSALTTLTAVPNNIDEWIVQFMAELAGKTLLLYSARMGYVRQCPAGGVVIIWDWSAKDEVVHEWYPTRALGEHQLQRAAVYYDSTVKDNKVELRQFPSIGVGSKSTIQLVSAESYAKWVTGQLN